MSDEDEYGDVSGASSTEVSFQAPASLVDRVEAIARVKDEEFASVLIEAVCTHLDDAAASEDARRRVAKRYYDDRISLEKVKRLVGSREAQRLRLLKADLRDDPLDL